MQETKVSPGLPLEKAWKRVFQWFADNTYAPNWLSGRWRHPVASYGLAVVLQLCILFVTGIITRVFPAFAFPGALAFIAITFISLNWGAGPGLVVTVISAFLINFLVLLPAFTWDIDNWDDVLEMVLFLAVGIGITVMANQRERARQSAEELASSLQRTESEAAARASQLEATFEAMSDIVLLYDKSGQVLYANGAARDLYGIGGQPGYYVRPVGERLNPYIVKDELGQALPREQWPLTRVLRGEELHSDNAPDVIMVAPDGSDIQLNVTGSPVRATDGQMIGSVIICRDVTERRLLERRTREALEALLVMAETLVQIPGSVDDDGSEKNFAETTDAVTWRLVNLIRSVLGCKRVSLTALETDMRTPRSVAVIGISPEQEERWRARATGFNLHDLVIPSAYGRQLQTSEVTIIDMTKPPMSDFPNPFGIHTMLLAPMSVGKQLVGMLSLDFGEVDHEFTQEEISLAKVVAKLAALVLERERLLQERAQARANELALREANRRMDEFLGIASHELRTPMTTIKGNIQLAKRRLDRIHPQRDRDEQVLAGKIDVVRDLLERAERQMRMQDRLVNDLLDVSRIQVDKLEMRIELCDLAVIVSDATQEQQMVVAPRPVHFSLEADKNVPIMVMADADRIGQVVTNYVTNALKYSAAATPVEVCLRVEGQEARVLVKDRGPGLSPEQQQHIWERFYRVEGINVQSGSGVGLGLGLHICRTIIEEHSGQVGVQSAPGEGATFWFSLPLVEKPCA